MARLEDQFVGGHFTPFETVLSDNNTCTEPPKAKKQKTRKSKFFLTTLCVQEIMFVTALHVQMRFLLS